MQQNQNPNKVAATEAPRRVISLLVDNHNGVLARVSSLFCRRGFNIDSLTVSATNDPAVSRITVTLHGDDAAISQLILQTERLEVTRQVFELTPDKSLQRELLLLKVACNTAERAEMREIATIYKSKIIDLSPDSMVFELTGRPEKINAFLKMFSGYDILELCRTGITALERGGKHPHMQKPPQEVRAAQLPLPGFLGRTVKSLSNCNMGVSMILIGAIIGSSRMGKLWDKDCFLYCLIRLGLIPAAVLLGCRLCGADSLVAGVSVVLAAMPMGGVTAVLAEKYGGDSAFASKCVAVSTVLSLITTPLWCMVV